MLIHNKDIHSQWQVYISTSENTCHFHWHINTKNQRKIGRIFNKLKQCYEIGTIIPKSNKYISCIILDTCGNQLHCGNQLAVYKSDKLIELRQDRGRNLENEILKTMPVGLEREVLAIINYIENTT